MVNSIFIWEMLLALHVIYHKLTVGKISDKTESDTRKTVTFNGLKGKFFKWKQAVKRVKTNFLHFFFNSMLNVKI